MNPEIDVFGGIAGRTRRNRMCTVFTGKEAAVGWLWCNERVVKIQHGNNVSPLVWPWGLSPHGFEQPVQFISERFSRLSTDLAVGKLHRTSVRP